MKIEIDKAIKALEELYPKLLAGEMKLMVHLINENLKLASKEIEKQITDYIEEYSDVIFVREQINGKWGSFSLQQLPKDLAEKHIQRFLAEGCKPLRVKRESEMKEVNEDDKS